jgi:O-antigen ligase
MKTYNVRAPELKFSKDNGRLDKLSLILCFIAIIISAASALAIGKIGALILLLVPVLFFLLLVFVQPDYGLLIFIFITAAQVSNVAIQFFHLPSLAQPLAGLLMAVILLRIILYRERPLNWGRIAPVLMVYIFVLFISLFKAADFQASSASFIGFIKDALGGVIVIFLIQRPASFRQAIWAFIIAGIFMGSIGVFQTITRTFDNPYFGFGGWESQSAGQQSRNRLTGPYDNPNAYSQVMVVIFALALERLWHEKRPLLRIFAGWSAIATSLTVVFTYSRGGLLTLIAAIGILFLQSRPKILPILLTFIVGLSLIQFLPSDYTAHMSTLQDILPGQSSSQINDPSFRGRLSENIAGWRMFLQNPVFGVGLGNFEIQYQNYSRQIGLDVRRGARTPASLYLEILSEQGLLGVLSFSLLIYTIFSGLIKARLQFAHAGMHDQSNIVMALIAGFAAYMVAATVKNSAYSNVYWILVGITLSAAQIALVSSREKSAMIGLTKHHE